MLKAIKNNARHDLEKKKKMERERRNLISNLRGARLLKGGLKRKKKKSAENK